MAEQWIEAGPDMTDFVEAKPVPSNIEAWTNALRPVPALTVAGLVESGAGIADLLGMSETATGLRMGPEAIRKYVGETMPVEETSWAGAGRSAATSIFTQLPLYLVAYLTGGATLPLVGMGGIAGTQKVSELKGAGVSTGEAAALGAVSGAVEVITEKIPFTKFLDLLKGNKAVASKIAGLMISEQLGEQAANVSDQVIEQVKPNTSWNWDDFKKSVVATAKATLIQAGVMSGGGAAIGSMGREKAAPVPPPVVTEPTGKRKEVIEARKVAEVAEQGELGFIEAKPVEKITKPQGELAFEEAPPAVEEGVPAVKKAAPFVKTIDKVETLSPEELRTLQDMGYSINKKELAQRTPDEWRLAIWETQNRQHTPEEIAAAQAAQAGLDKMEQEKAAEKNAAINRAEELGIADRILTSDANNTVRELPADDIKRIVAAVDGKQPVSKRHAQARAAADRVAKKVEEIEAKIESGELDAHIPDAALARIETDLVNLDRIGKMSDAELDTYFKEKVLLPGKEEPSEFEVFAAQERTRLEGMSDEQLDQHIVDIWNEKPVEARVPVSSLTNAKEEWLRKNGVRIEHLKKLEKRGDASEEVRQELRKLREAYENFTIRPSDPTKSRVEEVKINVSQIPEADIDTFISRVKSLYDQGGEIDTSNIGPNLSKKEKLSIINDFSEGNSTDIGLMEEVFGSTAIAESVSPQQVAAKIEAPIIAEAPVAEPGKARVARARATALQNKIDKLEERIDDANNADTPNDTLIAKLEKQRDEAQAKMDAMEGATPGQKEGTTAEVYAAQMKKKKAASEPEPWSREATELTYEISDNMGIPFEEAKAKIKAAIKEVPDVNLAEALKMMRDRFGVAEEATTNKLEENLKKAREEFEVIKARGASEMRLAPEENLVRAYKNLPENVRDLVMTKRLIDRAEDAAANRKPLDKFERGKYLDTLYEAAKKSGMSEKEAVVMRETGAAILDALKRRPTFTTELMEGGKPETAGEYKLLENLVRLKNPKAAAHEIGHWAFWNVLSRADRSAFLDIVKEKYYTEGRLDRSKLRQDSSNPEGMYSPSEIFASRFSDYAAEKGLTPMERSFLKKVTDFFRNLIGKVTSKTGHDFSDVSDILDKIVDTTGKRREWTGKGALGKYDWRQGGLGRRALAEGVREEATLPPSYTLDSMGMQQTYEKIADWVKRVRTVKDGPTTKIVKELQGEEGPQVLYKTDKPADVKRWSEWVMSPLQLFRKDPLGEKKVFDLMSANQYAGWATHQHYSALRNMQDGLTEGERVNVRKVLEGKIPGNPLEQRAAGEVRAWLDAMRARYQDHLRAEFKTNLTPEENEIVSRLIAKEDFLSVNLRANKLKVDIAVAWDLAKKYKDVDKWGLDDYVTKVELGKWKILDERKDVVAVALTESDAIRKATAYMEENPTATKLFLDDSFIAFGEDIKGLSRKQYWSIVNKLQKGIQDNVDGLNKGIAKHLAQKAVGRQFIVEPTKVWSPFTQPRRDVLKGEEDIFPVLFSYARSIEKKMNLDPVLDDIRKVAQGMPPNKQRALLNLAEDVKGKYYIEDQIADDIIKWMKIDAQSKAASRAVGDIKSFEANIKLGYRPVAATVNLLSGQAHTWVKTGNEYYAKGVRFLNTEEGKVFIKEEEPYFGVNVVEDALGTIRSEAEWYHPLGLFQAVEPINRKVSLASNYVMAREKYNMSHEAAREFARKANWFQQFTYDIASLPKIMRSPLGRLMTQFKPYLVKEIEFVRGLKGMEVGRYMAAQLALGGPRGAITVLKSLPILGALGLLDDIEEWMNKEWPRVSRGVGGFIGVDVTAPATIQFPSGAADILGPFFSDVARFMKDLPTLYTNIIKPALTGGDVEKDVPDLRNTLGRIVVAAKYWNRLIDQMVDKDGWVRDDKGAKIYQLPDTTADKMAFAGKMVAGAEDVEISKQTLASRLEERERKRAEDQASMTVNRALRILRARGELSDAMSAELAAIGVSGKSIKNTAIWREMTPQQRAVTRATLIRKGAVLEGWPVAGEYYEE
uniref:Uncharacterized protein n=2 Tax=viral metagenome TaxID=1070528 RepID=A0A6M3JDX7_9ZZZZ